MKLRLHHIPVCPFSQRVEILLALKGIRGAVDFNVIDITKPRPGYLTELTRGTTALPVMEVDERTPIKESLVILRFLEHLFPETVVARVDAYEHALESLLVAQERAFTKAGYSMILNQDPEKREYWSGQILSVYRAMNSILRDYAPGKVFFFDRFGWAEIVFTPLFQRFWFLEYYEGFELPEGTEFDRVQKWRAACLDEACAGQVSYEQIVKLYYDYAKGAGDGSAVGGREVSSFVFDPDWPERPMPPPDKYGVSATDADLGLGR
ncbi:MAG: glutathione S-transferase family protein [Boseongicola sp.]|nr:MAG: glutathione S-transferase family protein [Boseongicola sp.]